MTDGLRAAAEDSMQLYYDCFAIEFVEEKDPYAPPERYIRYGTTGTDDQYVEHWIGERDVQVTVRYSEDEIEAHRVEEMRRREAAAMGTKIRLLTEFDIPTPKWQELINRYKGENDETNL